MQSQKQHVRNLVVLSSSVVALLLVCVPTVRAYTIEDTGTKEVYNDFVVGPGKIEVDMKPGETKTVDVHVANRMGMDKLFGLSTEDFTGSQDANQTVILLGDEHGPYTLKDYLKPDVTKILLHHGQKATIPVTISVPANAEPGGRYGALLISVVTTPGQPAQGGIGGGAAIISRLGALFFVRVAGDAKESGALTEFSIKGNRFIFDEGPITLRLLYNNDGSVHLDPYGTITISNISGTAIDTITADPWVAMPASLRLREIVWGDNRPFLIGRYVAKAEINRGYRNIIDTKEIVFWYLPWKPMALVFVGLAFFIVLVRYISTHFKLARK